MTAYNDLPQASFLYGECEKVDQAIALIDHQDGTLTQFSVAPQMPPPTVTPYATASAMSAVMINLPNPAQESTMVAIREQLVIYQQSLVDQLIELGVTAPPTKAV